jgi:hypothetical protein
MSSWDDLLDGVRRRRADAIAKHAAELMAIDVIEALIIEAATLRDPPPPEPVTEPEPEFTWTEIWRGHPAAEDFFRQFPDGFPEDRVMQS